LSRTFFNSKGIFINELLCLTAKEANELLSVNAVLLDVRPEFEVAMRQFDVKNVIYIPHFQIESRYHEIPAEQAVILADASGLRSKEVAVFLKNKGFSNIALLAGGMVDWERAGFSVTRNKGNTLHGQCPCMLNVKPDPSQKL